MPEKTLTMLSLYPSISDFVEKYCKHCDKNCEIPSLEMFACVFKKLNRIEKRKDLL